MAKGYRTAFFAYPAQPADLAVTISSAITASNASETGIKIQGWPQLPVFGANIADEVRKGIKYADVLVADITRPNLNVYYEIGYAVGEGRTVAPVLNASFANASQAVQRDGIFDNIGYQSYENHEQLRAALASLPEHNLQELYAKPINFQQPLFVLQSFRKTDFLNSLVSAVKDARVHFRSFDPAEIPRLSAVSMIAEISASSGVMVPLLPTHIDDYERHNLRAAFVAGLSHGLQRQTLIIQQQGDGNPVPADFRDLVTTLSMDAIPQAVEQFARNSLILTQTAPKASATRKKSRLQVLALGSSAAENEFRTLGDYFVETSEYLRALRGEVKVVAGRKGAGKTAIFFRVRDTVRNRSSSVVVDLKPESHQLSLFREKLLTQVGPGLFDHTLAAFWYFLVLAEILLTIKRSFDHKARYDGRALERSNAIREILEEFEISESGDFTMRLSRLEQTLVRELERLQKSGNSASPNAFTNLMFKGGIGKIKEAIVAETSSDATILFLFDNIDKGWPSNGVQEFDVRLVRLLVETLDKVGRDFAVFSREFLSVVFLRNDVYELMVAATPDRQKAGQVRIDWTDRAKLRQVIYQRLIAATGEKDTPFESLWVKFFPEYISGKPSFDYLLDHCLMRPRFLINIVEYAIANAVNRGHAMVTEADCVDAIAQHSNYLVDDFGYEIRDVSGLSAELLYAFIGSGDLLTYREVIEILKKAGFDEAQSKHALRLMLWYGVLGISSRDGDEKYIYDYDYNERRLVAEVDLQSGDVLYIVNPALHVALR
jgi:hypothetical protein